MRLPRRITTGYAIHPIPTPRCFVRLRSNSPGLVLLPLQLPSDAAIASVTRNPAMYAPCSAQACVLAGCPANLHSIPNSFCPPLTSRLAVCSAAGLGKRVGVIDVGFDADLVSA